MLLDSVCPSMFLVDSATVAPERQLVTLLRAGLSASSLLFAVMKIGVSFATLDISSRAFEVNQIVDSCRE